ncbi:acyl-CoA desaturase [Noviherbaspirillum cavernae]|uniref:Acyl-CoA desaturase n=1 Tax=Noviherbaspirillum cavernae TaxID=2320862 RepID=A0A418X2T1_9BURK|nr:fatty acid desaturase [Noviherbaspirillum cavernae]RJG06777.1 acyl-CoA desaturase [Noviherbaspirillum cavernae]
MLNPVLEFLSNGLSNADAWQVVAYAFATTHITIAAVTIYLHRCQAHRALELHPLASHFFRFWLWLTTGMVTREWVAIHRKHHAKCETKDDPHSPNTRGIWKVLFEGTELYRAEAKNKETTEKYGHSTPEDWIESRLYGKYTWQGVGLLLIIDVLLFGVIGLTVWAFQMLWIPVTAAGVVNGIGHYWGYRNYDCPDASTNILPIGILIGGEEFHNNHHTFATSAKMSSKWCEFDVGWLYIRILETLRLAKVKKIAPVPKFDRNKTVVDSETLLSVIANRYDVTARYARSLRQAWRDELARLKTEPTSELKLRKSAKKLLRHAPGKLDALESEKLSQLFAHSEALQTMLDMRMELADIWNSSHASQEQLLRQLRDWCTRAENSGIKALQDFSLRLRSYS